MWYSCMDNKGVKMRNKTFKEFYLTEKPLTPSQRIARSRLMKRLAPKLKLKRKLAMKKKASSETIKKRAEKKAKDVLRKKFTPDGMNYADLSFSQKAVIEKKLEKKKGAIKKIARKLIKQLKQAEADRLKQLKDTQK